MPLTVLRTPGLLPSPSRSQLAAFSVTEFGGLYGAGGIGCLPQPLLGERIQAALKPNQAAVVGPGDSLNVLAERHGTTVTTLRSLNTRRVLPSMPNGQPTILILHYYAEQSCTAGRAAFISGQSVFRTGQFGKNHFGVPRQ